MNQQKQKIKLKCLKCNYEWETKSELIKVSCPSCGNKVINEIIRKKVAKEFLTALKGKE